MSAAKDITGMRFGKLVAIECIGSNKYKQRVWRCKCDCGNYHETAANTLLMGHIKSCGCANREDLLGKSFGNLTVVRYVGKGHQKNNPPLWECRCKCGAVVTTTSTMLKSGHKRSCGCLKKTNRVYEICGVGFCLMASGEYFWFDLEDIDLVQSYSWRPDTSGRASHGSSRITGEKQNYFYRQVMHCPADMTVDHINHDVRDNRKCNLRVCTQAENSGNVHGKGYYFYKRTGQWHTSICHGGKSIFLGYFNTEAEAAAAYAAAKDRLRGEFACRCPVDYAFYPL